MAGPSANAGGLVLSKERQEEFAMGWNASGRPSAGAKPPTPAKRKANGRLALTAAVLLACALAGGYALFRLDFAGEAKPSKGKPSDGSRAIPAAKPAGRRPASGTNAAACAVAKTNEYWLGVEVDHRRAHTNGTMVIETIYTKDGKSHKYYHDTHPPVFEHSTDQILALATADAPGGAPPLPMVSNFEAEFARSLKTEIVISDEDPPAIREMKERVKAARKEMLELMAEGMKAEDVLKNAELQRERGVAERV